MKAQMRLANIVRYILIFAFAVCSISLFYSFLTVEADRYKLQRQNSSIVDFNKTVQHARINGKYVLEKKLFSRVSKCQNYTTRLYDQGTFEPVALVSYPGSGNTWLRHLIELGTGAFTGSLYFDGILLAKGFLGEKEDWTSGSTVVQKLHMNYNKAFQFKKGILLIREPYTAIRSMVQYLESGHTGWTLPLTFVKKEWPVYMLHSVYNWLTLAKSWLESPVELLVVYYENLCENPVQEVLRICDFLKIDCMRIHSSCFKNITNGNFHRKKYPTKTKLYLPSEYQVIVAKSIEYLNQLLVKYKNNPLPLDKYTERRNFAIHVVNNTKYS